MVVPEYLRVKNLSRDRQKRQNAELKNMAKVEDRRKPRPDAGPVPDRRSGGDRRKFERVLVDWSVDYKANDTFLFAYISDISEMGIFVRTETPEPPGTRLNLRFTPPKSEPLELEGQVTWINPPRPGEGPNRQPGMGIRFMDLTPTQRDQLLRLVRTFAYLDDDELGDDAEARGHS